MAKGRYSNYKSFYDGIRHSKYAREKLKMPKIRQFVSVVAYVHNNANKISKFITTIMKECEIFTQREIIFVDDYSKDDSVEIIIRTIHLIIWSALFEWEDIMVWKFP